MHGGLEFLPQCLTDNQAGRPKNVITDVLATQELRSERFDAHPEGVFNP